MVKTMARRNIEIVEFRRILIEVKQFFVELICKHRRKPSVFRTKRKEGSDLTQSYDKNPYTNRNFKRAK